MRVTIMVPVGKVSYQGPAPDKLKVVKAMMAGLRNEPQSITVTRLPHDLYRITAGHHILSAYRLLGRDTILAHVGIEEAPYPFKDTVHGPDKPIIHRNDPGYQDSMPKRTWLHL